MFNKTSDRNKLVMHYPASWWRNMWREALPTGNGMVGASVYGAIGKETIIINHSELWHMGVKNKLPDVSHTLKETREFMKKRKFDQANWHLTQALQEAGYFSTLAKPLPLTNFHIEMPNEGSFTDYARGLNMETGEVRVEWKNNNVRYRRNVFTSHAKNLIVCQISSYPKQCHQALLSFSLPPTETYSCRDRINQLEKTVEYNGEGKFLFFKATNGDGTDYGAVAKVLGDSSKLNFKDGKLSCENFNNLLILIKVFIQSKAEEEWLNIKDDLNGINGDYTSLLQEHLAIYQPLFLSSSLQLTEDKKEMFNEELLIDAYHLKADTRLFEKLWAYGRYLFLSGTSVQGQPFSMYGLWHGDYNLMWSHRMANENIQMMYWHVGVGGLSEYTNALLNYYWSMLEDFRENAKKLYGCKGIYIPAGTTPGQGKPNQIVPVILNWTSAAGWLAQHFYEYYLFTGDIKKLRGKILPFMKEVADFYLDFIEQSDGELKYYPSVSPENTPLNFLPNSKEPLAHPMPTTINATMDIAIMKELLTNLLEGSKKLSIYETYRSEWIDLLNRIPSYRISSDGAINEWIDEQFKDNHQHRHFSFIYPIFPGKETVTKMEIFKNAVEKRETKSQTGWSYAHLANIHARLLNGNKALFSLELLAQSCLLSNFFTVHNDWRNMGSTMDVPTAPVQLDANMGIVNAMQEMLFYVSPSRIRLLPALPDKWKKGRVNNFHFYTGTVSFQWNREKQQFHCVIKATRETNSVLQLPNFIGSVKWSGESARPTKNGEWLIKMKPGEAVCVSTEEVHGEWNLADH